MNKNSNKKSLGVLNIEQQDGMPFPPTATHIPVPALKDTAGWYQFCFGPNAYQWKLSYQASISSVEVMEMEEAEEVVDTMIASAAEIIAESPVTELALEMEEEEEIVNEDILQLLESKKNLLQKKEVIMDDEEEDMELLKTMETKEQYIRYDPTLHTSYYYPTTTLLLQWDHVMNQRVLGYMIDWWVEEFPVLGRNDESSSSACNNWLHTLSSSSFSTSSIVLGELYSRMYYRSVWLYGVFVRLEPPLYREICAHLRELSKHCISMRIGWMSYIRKESVSTEDIRKEEKEVKEEEDQLQLILAILNMLIYITCVYFNQGADLLNEIGDL